MRKLTALLLALLMLALPTMSMAATNVTVTLSPSGDLAAMLGEEAGSIYQDVMNALGLTVYKDEDNHQGGAALQLGGTDVLTIDVATNDDTLSIKSNFLGDKTLAVSADEWEPLLERLTSLLVEATGMDEAEAKAMKDELTAALAGMGRSGVAQLTEEDILALDWTPVLEAISPVLERAEVAEVAQQPENSDPAAQMMTTTITAQDVVAVYEALAQVLKSSETVLAYLDQMMAGADMTGAQMLDEMVAEVKNATASMKDVVLTAYLDEAGEIVCATLPVEITEAGGTMLLDLAYNRLTDEHGVNHRFIMPVLADGEQAMNLDLTVLDGGEASMVTMSLSVADEVALTMNGVFDEENTDFTMTVAVEDVQMEMKALKSKETADFSLTLNADGVSIALTVANATTVSESETLRTGSVNLALTTQGTTMGIMGNYAASSAADGSADKVACELALNLMGSQLPLGTVMVDIDRTAEGKASIAAEDAVHPGTLNDEEFSALGEEITQAAATQLVALVQSLPESVLNMMMAQ